MSTEIQDAFYIIQCINFAITIIFLLVFIWRIYKLHHLATSQRYLNVYPKPRIILAAIYIVISIGLLAFNLAEGMFQNFFYYFLAGGGGQCINSVILIIQLFVLRQQLKKQRPYTCFHLIYSIYLVIISCIRFILTLYYLLQNVDVNIQKVDLTLTVLLMVDCTLLLGYWLAKRQQLPQFEEIRYFNMDNFTSSNRFISTNIKVSDTHSRDMTTGDFPFIFPTVSIQKNNFKVTLEMMTTNIFLQLEQTNQNKGRQSEKRLQVIAEGVYTAQQLRQLYILCGRFSLKSNVKFYDTNYVELYKQMQTFLDEVFSNPTCYKNFVLRFFQVSAQIIEKYQHLKGRASHYDNQQDKYDMNATYISICLYKQLWVDDHYIFYLRATTSEQQFKSHPMKRYSDFQELDTQLRSMIALKKNGNWKLQLPQLPKKHSFYWDQSRIAKRRKELQVYIRKIANDSCLMEFPQIRERIFAFLHFKNVYNITPAYKESYYEGFDIVKGNITKALVLDEYVTFYEFKLFNNGIEIGNIKKRFSDFIALHQDLKRYMNNIKITYKSIELPEKHLFRSESNRHQKLLQYLKNVIEIRQVYKIYELAVFFNIGSDKSLDDDSLYGPISIIRTNQPSLRNQSRNPSSPTRSPTKIGFMKRQEPSNQIQMPNGSSYSSNQRMSALIQQLGKNGDFQQEI